MELCLCDSWVSCHTSFCDIKAKVLECFHLQTANTRQNNWQIQQKCKHHKFEQQQCKDKSIPYQVVPPNDLQNLAAQWLHHGLNLDLSGQLGLGLPHQMSGMRIFPRIHIKAIIGKLNKYKSSVYHWLIAACTRNKARGINGVPQAVSQHLLKEYTRTFRRCNTNDSQIEK